MDRAETNVKITVIMPSLNVVDYIREALDSARYQTLRDIEILCIDAGSTDGTLEFLNTAEREDSRVQIIESDKRSYGYQVNLGIKKARGKYIAILETDDYVDPDMYRKLYDIAEANDADYVKADYDAFFSQSDGTYYHFPRHSFSDRSFYQKLLHPLNHAEIGRDDWYLWQGIYRKEYLLKNSIFLSETPGAAYQDIGFLFWTGAVAERAVYSRDILYHYRIDRDTASSNSGKGLRFSYAEFNTLINAVQESELVDEKVKRLLFARMAKSFVSCYSGISEDPADRDDRKIIYEWFRDQLRDAAERGVIDEELVQTGRWARLKALLDSEDAYFEKYSERLSGEKLLNAGDSFAIFGCGDFGFKAYKSIRALGKRVLLFMDNNSELWGKTLNGVRIDRLEAALDLDDDVHIVIANEAYHDAIKEQLIELGVSEERLLLYI